MRIAVVSTPRSGNTWLRRVLADVLGLEQLAVHSPSEVPWTSLSDNLILQLHWYPTADFYGLLLSSGFQPISIMRHPLDVLLSIHHFSQWELETNRWLEGLGGSEDELRGSLPSDEPLLEYALGSRFAALLDVSAQWARTGIHSVRYEDFVRNSANELARVVSAVGGSAAPSSLEQTLRRHSVSNARTGTSNGHFWQGQVGTWRGFLPGSAVERIAPSLSRWIEPFGYVVEADTSLTRAQAGSNFLRSIAESASSRARLLAIQQANKDSQDQKIMLDECQKNLEELAVMLDRSQSDLIDLQRRYGELTAQSNRHLEEVKAVVESRDFTAKNVQALSEENGHLRRELRAIYDSGSWKTGRFVCHLLHKSGLMFLLRQPGRIIFGRIVGRAARSSTQRSESA